MLSMYLEKQRKPVGKVYLHVHSSFATPTRAMRNSWVLSSYVRLEE